MTNTQIKATADQVIASTYARFPIAIQSGSGATLTDADGKTYIDFVAGIAVCNLGHCHPKVTAAIQEQAQTLLHVSNLYYTGPQTELARWLVDHSFADRVFFCNSGAEANEAAIKLARKYASDKGKKDKYRIIGMTQSFHGRTMAALSATGQDKIKKGFEPVLPGFSFVPYNDPRALADAMDDTVCAVILEPLQGEGGIVKPAPGYLADVRKICKTFDALMILDEIQTGLGRTGSLFAHTRHDFTPDIMTLAKGLGNGVPIGAMLATEKVAASFGPGSHGSTFGGSPLAAAAANAVVRTLVDDGVIEHGREMGLYLREKLQLLAEKHAIASEVRGIGLLLGLGLKTEGAPVVTEMMRRGFLINCVQGTVLRFVPPLVIQKSEIDAMLDALDDVLGHMDVNTE